MTQSGGHHLPPPLDSLVHPASALWGRARLASLASGGVEVVELDSGVRPWSGYWYPLAGASSQRAIHEALARYDRLTGGQALQWQLDSERSSIGRPESWEGRCDAWALASILEAPPRSRDEQVLKTLSYEQVDPGQILIFGKRNDGEGGHSFEDMLPMELHRILVRQLKELRRPFILDRDPRPPVWNTPIWGARWERTEEVPVVGTPDAGKRSWRVSLDLYGTLPLAEPKIAPTIPVVLHYEYRLWTIDGGFGGDWVVESEWLGRSKGDHPDFATIPIDAVPSHRSRNPELDLSRMDGRWDSW